MKVSELKPGAERGQSSFEVDYEPEFPTFESFRSWFMEKGGPYWKANAGKLETDTMTCLGEGRALISGGVASVPRVREELLMSLPLSQKPDESSK